MPQPFQLSTYNYRHLSVSQVNAEISLGRTARVSRARRVAKAVALAITPDPPTSPWARYDTSNCSPNPMVIHRGRGWTHIWWWEIPPPNVGLHIAILLATTDEIPAEPGHHAKTPEKWCFRNRTRPSPAILASVHGYVLLKLSPIGHSWWHARSHDPSST